MKHVTVMAALTALALLPTISDARTTWSERMVDDPILEGAQCKVLSLNSTGSYIYSYPSKYDLVFVPNTEEEGIWYCPQSGFISLANNFNTLSKEEIVTISQSLKGWTPRDLSYEEKLYHMEFVYSLRTTSDGFQSYLKRIIAYGLDRLGHYKKAKQYRALVLEDLEQELTKDLSPGDRSETLFLAAGYSRYLGKTAKSDQYIKALKHHIESNTDEELDGYHEYLAGLLDNVIKITPAGPLAVNET